jgi:hypothetical protein
MVVGRRYGRHRRIAAIEGEIRSDVALAIVAASGNTPSTLLGVGDDAPEPRWRCTTRRTPERAPRNAITAAQPNARFRFS